MHLQWLLGWLLTGSLFCPIAAYDPAPRWAQAVVLVNDALYVHGGKVDPSNQYSYSSAPNTNEVLLLSLSSQFSPQAPPWTLVSSSIDESMSLSWHSISAFNTTHSLLFGGQPDPNSQIVLVTSADSAAIFDVSTPSSPVWIPEPSSWGGQPIRRQRHSSTTSTAGHVFIIGGERSDGSQLGFSDHSYFSGNAMTFNFLPTSNAPPDLYGHASVILPDDRILVFGGYSPSQSRLLPFSTIWVLDTSKMHWSVVNTDTLSLPSPRIAFAAAFIGSGKVMIHGGCDSSFQTNLPDGWVLDTTTNPWKWSRVDALSQIGARRDHFAVSYGGQVIFGFGYSANGPASAALEVYSPSSSTFVSTYAPPPASSTTPTIPPIPSRSSTSTNEPSGSNTTPSPPITNSDTGSGKVTAIALATVFGILGLVVVGLGLAYYIRRRRRLDGEREFLALGEDDGDIIGETRQLARSIPIVRMHNAPSQQGILGSLGVALKMKSTRGKAPRRDMLADEDARSFGEWYSHQKNVAGSTWSLKSILGSGMRTRSRQGSSGSYPASPLGEKDFFADPDTVTRDEYTGLISLTARVPSRRSRQETSYQSWKSGSVYRDPFSDPIYDDVGDFDSVDLYKDYGHTLPADQATESLERHPTRTSGRPPLTKLQSVLPVSQGGHPLSPLTEQTSQTMSSQKITLSDSSHSDDIPMNPVDSAPSSSSSSFPPRSASIINTSNPSLLSGGGQPIRRSDSWWARFARANLLDRRTSGTSKKATYEIRDPNPAPKLSSIEEGTQSLTPVVPEKAKLLQLPVTFGGTLPPRTRQEIGQTGSTEPSRAISSRIYGVEGHGKSLSSFKTADSEAIERMAGTMDVVHYMKSRGPSGYRNSASGLSIETFSSASVLDTALDEGPDDDNLIMFASPLDLEPTSPTFRHPLAADQGDDPTLPHAVDAALPPSPGNVVNKVRQYERRMSADVPVSPTTPDTRQREERTNKRVEVKYGLAPKPSLFVANPDRSGSADS